jgi:lysyl-tRNA synthetase class II
MKAKGFLGVETPYLELTTGGAEARPFGDASQRLSISMSISASVSGRALAEASSSGRV